MDTVGPRECEVCLQSYDENDRRPRVLLCGHTFCTACIALVIKQGDLQCPTCRIEHHVISVEDIPINYCVEKIVQKWHRVRQSPVQDQSGGSSRRLKFLQEDALADLKKQQCQCQEVNDELDQYCQQLLSWQHDHQQLNTALRELLQHNEITDQLVIEERQVVAELKEKVETMTQRSKHQQEQLHAACNTAQLEAAVEDADICTYETGQWLELNSSCIPNMKVVSSFLKVREATKKAVQVGGQVMQGCIPESQAFAHGEGTHKIMDKVKMLDELAFALCTAMTVTTISDLQRDLKTGPAMEWLEAGQKVVAGVRVADGCRYTKLTLWEGRIHLHCLQHRPTPDQLCQFHIQLLVKDVASNVDKWASVAFLDLCWGGATRGRLYIRLLPNNILAQQFLLLCWGSRSFNYRGTKLLEVWDKGRPMERVLGGDYEQNNGEGGASLLQRLDDDAYQWWPSTAGLVESRIRAGKNKSSQFVIATKDYSNLFFSAPLGNVEQGLEVLREAVSLRDITEVTVSDCGVVVDL